MKIYYNFDFQTSFGLSKRLWNTTLYLGAILKLLFFVLSHID